MLEGAIDTGIPAELPKIPLVYEPAKIRKPGDKMDRRDFLKLGAGAVGAAVAGSIFLPDIKVGATDLPEQFHKLEQQSDFVKGLFNAGTVTISMRTKDGIKSGQAYLEKVGNKVVVRTIEHMVDEGDEAVISIPSRKGAYELTVPLADFVFSGKSSDPDRSAAIGIGGEAGRIISNDNSIGEIKRTKSHSKFKVGGYVGCPHPDTGRWTIYKIRGINTKNNTIELDNTEAGAIGEGRSGGPLFLIEKDGDDYGIISEGDKGIVVGEVEGPLDSSDQDFHKGRFYSRHIRANIVA